MIKLHIITCNYTTIFIIIRITFDIKSSSILIASFMSQVFRILGTSINIIIGTIGIKLGTKIRIERRCITGPP
mgnify:CR=1 FL=1